jgi:hypothetical protein
MPFVGERCPKALGTLGGRLGQAAFGGNVANPVLNEIQANDSSFVEKEFVPRMARIVSN